MNVSHREKTKGVWQRDYTANRRAASETVGITPRFAVNIIFIVLVFMNPVAVVQAVSLLFSFDWMNAIALVVTIVGGVVIELLLIHIHDSYVWKKIIDHYFCDFDGCYFEPTTIDLEQGLIQKRDILRYPSAKSLFLLQMPSIRAFYVRLGTSGIAPSTLTTYQMAGGTSYVFVTQRPEGMRSIARFFLLHEIGHAIVTNRIVHVQGWFAAVYFVLLFLFVAIHREVGILHLFVASALAAMWMYYLQKKGKNDERLELVADAFALVQLTGRPDFRTAIARIARIFRKGSEDDLFCRYRARVLIRRAQMLSRPGTEFSFGMVQEIVPPIPLWLSLLILAGMLWLGTTLSIGDLEELLALSVVLLVMPGLAYYYRVFLRVNRARREALAFLQRHAPPDMAEERRVTLFDLI